MIRWHELYTVMSAMVPLYVAMILAYGSVRWWKIFSPDQCSGVNRFVAIFAVPLLSFHFISSNDIYAMNFRFIAADTVQKVMMLALLGAWGSLSPQGSLEWVITLFSLSTLPNTLVMGIPLLIAMYGPYSGQLMVQVVVLQCIVWYTLLLFLFEFRAAKLLILDQFPETAASIVSFKVDSDVMSLDGRDFLETDAQIGRDGKLHVTVRKSNARASNLMMTPRPSNLTGAEIYSVSSTPRGSNFNHSEFYSMMAAAGAPPRHSNFSSSRGPTPRPSNFDDPHSPRFGFYPAPNPDFSSSKNAAAAAPPPPPPQSHDGKELHMFVWSSSASPVSEAFPGAAEQPGGEGAKEIRMMVPPEQDSNSNPTKEQTNNNSEGLGKDEQEMVGAGGKQMPPASVMTRLIMIMVWRKLIRNPNTYSSLIGLVWSLVSFRWHVEMPAIIKGSISILSDAGLGMAMFSLGLFMALQPKLIACGNSVATFAMAVRFLTGPAVMAVASIAVGLRGTLLHVAIVQAALPQGIVPFVFAKEYNVHPAVLSTAVIFGMLIALPITLLYYIVLGV